MNDAVQAPIRESARLAGEHLKGAAEHAKVAAGHAAQHARDGLHTASTNIQASLNNKTFWADAGRLAKGNPFKIAAGAGVLAAAGWGLANNSRKVAAARDAGADRSR